MSGYFYILDHTMRCAASNCVPRNGVRRSSLADKIRLNLVLIIQDSRAFMVPLFAISPHNNQTMGISDPGLVTFAESRYLTLTVSSLDTPVVRRSLPRKSHHPNAKS